jgi:hypothetical protein
MAFVSMPTRRDLADLSDEELNRYILTRLEIAGVDLSVLPEEDDTAPADQARILQSARSFLRSTVPAIAELRISPDDLVPALFPMALLRPDGGGFGGR